jgi:hypothetical protein
MTEAAIPESPMLALVGHMSRTMLERYSQFRMSAQHRTPAIPIFAMN